MKKLGEQWIEVIDGKRHLLMIVENTSELVCNGCSFGYYQAGDHHCKFGLDCPTSDGIIKDLGILNDEGLLPCPFCGEYPVIQPENRLAGFGCHCDKCKCAVSGLYESMEEVIEEWNRRA